MISKAKKTIEVSHARVFCWYHSADGMFGRETNFHQDYDHTHRGIVFVPSVEMTAPVLEN